MKMMDHPTRDTIQTLVRNFTFHLATPNSEQHMKVLKLQAKDLGVSILNLTPKCRERSLALTKLEEVIMWANSGICRNQEPE